MQWKFEHTGFHSGAFNMRYDGELARKVAAGELSNTVRVYGWNPPAISIGWNQSLEEINIEAAAEAGIDVVRRPTGGRAILHSTELTYSVIMPAEGKSVATVYREISSALVCGLQKLGIDASLEKSQPHFPTVYHTTSGAVCFSSSARHEIKVRGRKLVGSAQRRFFLSGQEVVLQHGSILLGPDHLRIIDFLSLKTEEVRQARRIELRAKTIDLKSVVGMAIEFDEVAEAIRCGFEEAWGVTFEDHPQLTTQEVLQL